jgi:lysophospholipase L1-like esterase
MMFVATSVFAQHKDWAKFDRYAAANETVVVAPKAVFLGDSITDGWAQKDSEFFTENNFVGRGISGQVTSQMLVRFRQDVIDLHPEYVVILAGTNDIALNNGYITLENIMDNLMSICELAKLHQIKPILCSVLPVDKYLWRLEVENPAEEVIKLNKMIKAYAESENIPYVDYHAELSDEKGALPLKYSSDHVHPNMDCYKVMEEIILRRF